LPPSSSLSRFTEWAFYLPLKVKTLGLADYSLNIDSGSDAAGCEAALFEWAESYDTKVRFPHNSTTPNTYHDQRDSGLGASKTLPCPYVEG
jgi:hypothetical protein